MAEEPHNRKLLPTINAKIAKYQEQIKVHSRISEIISDSD